MRIQHNIMAMSSYRNYTNNVNSMKANLEKLSSGYKINRAGDDAAGLAISEKMRAQITGLKQAQSNAKSAINLVQTAEGALQEVQDMLNRMVKLAEQSANGTYDDDVDRAQLQKEFNRLREEINRIDQSANFNGKPLFGGPGETTDPEGPPEGPEDSGLTAEDITQPTNNPAFSDGDASNAAKTVVDFTGVAFAKAGTVSVTVGGKAYDVTVTEDTDAVGFADAFAAAYNAADAADKISDEDAGAFTAVASNGKVTLTAANQSAVKDGDLKTALAAKPTIEPKATPAETAEEGEEAATKKYESTVTIKDNATTLAANDTIKIGGQTYTIKSSSSGASEIGLDTAATFDAQMAKAVEEYNKVDSEDFTAAYDAETGKMTFTVKDGKTPADAPTFTITDNANKISAGEVTEVEEPEEPEEPENPGNTTGQTFTFQVGDTNDSWNKIQVTINSISTSAIVDGKGTTLASLSIEDEDSAGSALGSLKEMVNYISDIRGDLGAAQNRLTHTINNLSVMEENIQDAESTIRDTDVADEMMAYTKNNILIQSAQAMLAQANQVPQGVLQLLQ